MAQTRTRVAQTAFTSGKLSPLVSSARIDLEKYARGCTDLDNFILLPQGGARRRPGFSYVATAKALAADGPPRLIPFVYSTEQAYMLEFGVRAGVGYVRFYKDGAQILGSPSGAELIANGDFAASLASWTTVDSGTGASTQAAGRANLAAGAAGVAAIRQSAAVTADTLYVISFELFTAATKVKIGSTAGGADILAETSLAPTPGAQTYVLASTTAAMWIEFTQDGAGVTSQVDNVSIKLAGALELASPYLAADLPNLDAEQSNDVLYLACAGYAPRKLTRTSHVNWRLRTITFRPPPTTESDTVMTGASLTLGALTGTGITVTASAAIFLQGDAGRQIRVGDGRAVITTFNTTTDVTVDILDDFAALTIAAGVWSLTGSPNSTLTPSKKGPIGTSVTLTSDTPATVFRATDVGKYVKINDGIVKVTAFVATNILRGEVMLALSSRDASASWSMEVDAWSATLGFPGSVAFSPGDRLCWAREQRVWGSVTGDYENLGVTTLDDAAFEFGINIGQANVARWLMGSDELVCGSTGAEHVLAGGGTDEVLTPTNVRQRADTTYGSKKLRPVRSGPALLFVDASGRELREHVYAFEEDRRVAPSLTLLSEHLFPVGQTITAIAYQRTPWSVVWARRSDGRLLGLTYLRAEDVVGWHDHPQDGSDTCADIAVIPHPDADREQLWAVNARVIGGTTVYYIEYLNDSSLFTDSSGVSYGQRGLDSSLTYEGAAATVISGLSHLEGRTVGIIADGAYVGTAVVAGGSITLETAATKVEVGLPFTSVLTPVAPEVPVDGTSAGTDKSAGPMFVRVVKTLGLKYDAGDGNNDEIPFRAIDDVMGSPPPLFTGTKVLDHIGWDTGAVTFRQEDPLPCTIVMIGGVLGIGQ